MTAIKTCKDCGKQLEGRKDQKFCSPYCKSAFHYQQRKDAPETLFRRIDLQLKLNRRVLGQYNREGKTTIRREVLLEEGFNPKYFTHYWKNTKGQVYLFCYEYGFLAITDNERPKYLLVTWQPYMDTR